MDPFKIPLTVNMMPTARIGNGTFVTTDVSCLQKVAAAEENLDEARRATVESYIPNNFPTIETCTPPEVGKHMLSTNKSAGTLDSVKFSIFATSLSSTDADIEIMLPVVRGTTHKTQVSLTQRLAAQDETVARTNTLGSDWEK